MALQSGLAHILCAGYCGAPHCLHFEPTRDVSEAIQRAIEGTVDIGAFEYVATEGAGGPAHD